MVAPVHFFNQQSGTKGVINGAEFCAQLTHSLVLNRGTGSPTFTRATTKTVMGYGPTANSGDSQILLTCAAGEAGFTGARRISEGVWSDTFANGNPIPLSTLKGYSAEGAATNLCLQSQTFATTWAASGVAAVSEGTTTSPDGTQTADTLQATAGNAAHYIAQALSPTAAAHTYSIYAKAGTHGFLQLTFGTQTAYANFNLSTGVVGTSSGVTSASITDAGEGWYRCVVVYANTATSSLVVSLAASASATRLLAFNAAGTETIVVWGAQLELGSFASSYIPTTTTAVARNADVESTPTSGNITAAAGTKYLEFTPTHAPVAATTIALWGTYVDASNYTAILHDGTNLIFRKRIAGANYDATIANAYTAGTTYKIAASWGTAGSTIYLNGTAGTPHANTTAAQIGSTQQIGADGNSLLQPGANIRNDRTWLTQKSASEQQAITS